MNIERYIHNEMQGQEIVEFEKALEEDAQLKSEYLLRKEVEDALSETDILDLREQLDHISDSYFQHAARPGFVKIWHRSKHWIAAASFTILISIGGLTYYHSHQPPSKDEIFTEYYKPYEVTVSFRSADTEINSLLTNALQAYQQENYNEALGLFQQVLEKRNDISAQMYSGISYMEIEKYRKANKSFQDVIKAKDNLFIDQAKWYSAMCYVKLGEIQNAKSLLMELSQTSAFYKNKSAEIIKELDRKLIKD